jgi:type IV pilus assembly protein PilX
MMNTAITACSYKLPFRKQAGIVLVVSMLVLVVITLLGITGMRNTTLEEKMAGNVRDTQMAFNAAEAALRNAESLLQAATLPAFKNADTDGDRVVDATATGGYYQPNTTIWKTINWDPTTAPTNQVIASTVAIPDLAAQPSLYIEEMPATSMGGSLEAGAALNVGTYRVTVRAVGGSATSEVILQETFRR